MADLNPLLIDVPVRLDTARLVLRPPQPGDGVALCEAVRDSLAHLRPWLPWAQGEPTVADSETHARRMHARYQLREDLPLFMFEREPDGSAGRFVGGTGLHRIDWTVPRFEIGYWCRSDRIGRGLVTEAVMALSRMAFDRLGAQRVELRMDDRNTDSWRVAERAGFTLEGVLRRDARAVDGRPRDTRVYARVRGVEEPSVEHTRGGG